jgi:hypothetical protein
MRHLRVLFRVVVSLRHMIGRIVVAGGVTLAGIDYMSMADGTYRREARL